MGAVRRVLYRVGRWLVHRYDPSRPRIEELNRQLAAKRAAGEEPVLMVNVMRSRRGDL